MADKRRDSKPCRFCGRPIPGAGPRARHEKKCGAGELATSRMNVVMTDRTRERLADVAARTGTPAWKVIGVAIEALTITEARRRLGKKRT